MTESRLEMATRHAGAGRRVVASQRQLVERLKANGRPTLDAERLLWLFEASLRIFEDDLRDALTEQEESGTGKTRRR